MKTKIRVIDELKSLVKSIQHEGKICSYAGLKLVKLFQHDFIKTKYVSYEDAILIINQFIESIENDVSLDKNYFNSIDESINEFICYEHFNIPMPKASNTKEYYGDAIFGYKAKIKECENELHNNKKCACFNCPV